MPSTMTTLSTSELVERLERREDLLLVNALSAESFAQEHIPGSVSVPGTSTGFVERVEQLAGSRNRHVVVHCSDRACQASTRGAQKLLDAGFSHVSHYADGIAGWKEAGYDVESAIARPVR